ncbi:MAG: phage protease [Aquabacterium sp.]
MRTAAFLLAASLALAASATGANGQAQLLPAGRFAAIDGRPGEGKQWTITDAQGRALAARLNAIAAATPLVIDYDHQTLRAAANGQRAPAAGWIHELAWRDGEGLFARVEWTAAATAHITAGEYRYISPVLFADPDTGQVTHISMASLVNNPALIGMEPVAAALSALVHPAQEKPDMALLAALIAALALPPETTEATALTAVTSLKTRAELPPKAVLPVALATALGVAPDAAEPVVLSAVAALRSTTPDGTTLAAMQALQGQVALLTNQLNGDKLSAVIDNALKEGKLLPAQKDWAHALGTKDMAALSGYLASAPVLTGLAGQSGGGGPGAGPQALASDPAALQVATQMGIPTKAWAEHKRTA